MPEFMRFYGYTRKQAMNEYARAFFALINEMYVLKAGEMLDDIATNRTAFAENKDAQKVIDKLQRQNEGTDRILNEVDSVKGGS